MLKCSSLWLYVHKVTFICFLLKFSEPGLMSIDILPSFYNSKRTSTGQTDYNIDNRVSKTRGIKSHTNAK